ncbi:MAG: FmdB family zinc ribbon protein [Limisphaerales bacterium]
MPTYAYVCEKCGHEFDLFQSMKDAALSVCPQDKCAKKRWGRGAVKRQLGTGAGLIFKGSGFYITDYRSKNYTEAAKKDAAPAAPAPAPASPSSSPSSSSSSSSPAPAKSPPKPAGGGGAKS